MTGRVVPCAEELEASADEFRARYARGHIGPLPIAFLIEKHLGVEIIPVRDLCRKTQSKGWVCSSGNQIIVDKHVFMFQPEEYRKLAAHETAHIVRHPDQLPEHPFTTIEECSRFHDHLSRENRWFMEAEADEWASRVLIPRTELLHVFEGLVRTDFAEFRKVLGDKGTGAFIGYAGDMVGLRFGVKPSVALARLRSDGLWQRMTELSASKRKFNRPWWRF